ncbi:serine/threonine protein kinase [Kitasatospora sp. NPDC091207]|uniref:serine/threonine protein kinase n=1 Tax=Kitasatospora sp. NPDC091207 TaxID=3364083 RepID=UPI00380DEA2B
MRGTTLGDRYRLDEWLGGGSMGDVWLAEDEVLGRRVAVKVLKPALLDEPGFAERFHEEARVMARLRHPGIVGVHDFGSGRTDGGQSWTTAWGNTGRPIAYLVMELIDGEPLSEILDRRGLLGTQETLGMALQVLAALQAAHEAGVVHRDIKPANLMVREDRVVIADFGIARPGCDTRLTVPGMVLGTAAYQAPEQASTGTVGASADLYALGVVLYECLSGRLPFHGETALEVILKHLTEPAPPLPADVPAPVRALVERAMAKDPAERWPDAAGMAAAARAAVAGEPVEGPATGTAGRAVVVAAARPVAGTGAATAARRPLARWRAVLGGRRRRSLIAAGAVLLCCVITAGTATVLRLHEDRTAAAGGPAVGEASVLPPGLAIPLSAPGPQVPESGAPSSPGASSPGASSPGAATASGAPAPTTPGGPGPGAGPGPAAGSGPGAGAGSGASGTPEAQGGGSGTPARPSTGGPPAAASSGPAAPAPGPAPGTSAAPVPPVYPTVAPPEKPSPSPSPAYTYLSPPPPPPPPYYTTPPIKPPTQPVGPLPSRARLSTGGSVLYDQGSLDQDGNPVVTTRDDGGPAAVWTLNPHQGGGYFLANGATQFTRVLDLEETYSRAQLWRSPPYSANQIWSFVPVAGGYMIVITKDSLRCLSAAGPSVPAAIRLCDGSSEQIWTVTAA